MRIVDYNPVAQVCGLESNGCVRGMGFGITNEQKDIRTRLDGQMTDLKSIFKKQDKHIAEIMEKVAAQGKGGHALTVEEDHMYGFTTYSSFLNE